MAHITRLPSRALVAPVSGVAVGPPGPPGPGTGAGAWQPSTAYTANQVVQAPDGSIIYRLSSGTSSTSFDGTEATLWAAVSSKPGTIEQVSQSVSTARSIAEDDYTWDMTPAEAVDTRTAAAVAAAVAAAPTVVAAAVDAVADVMDDSGIPPPAVAATNLLPDPRLNTPSNWSVSPSVTADWAGLGVVLTETANPGSAYIYEKSANAHVVVAGEKWSFAYTVEGLANIVGNAYIYMQCWASAGPSTQALPIAILGPANVALNASRRHVGLNLLIPAGANRMTVRFGVTGLTGIGTSFRLSDAVLLKRGAVDHVATDLYPLDGEQDYARWTGAVDLSPSERLDRLVANSEIVARYGAASVDDRLAMWAATPGAVQLVGAPTVDGDGIPTAGTVRWPDGSAGVYALVSKYGPISGVVAINAYTITHVTSGRMVTQPAFTRDVAGNITVAPAMTVGAI